MTSQTSLEKFNSIYEQTYLDILKYIIIKCHNVNDANDIIQEVYLEFWKILNKKNIEKNIKSYLIGIAINKIKKHYTLIGRFKTISIFDKKDKDIQLIDNLNNGIDIEDIVIKNEDWKHIWNYIKSKKNQNIPKIFYLYYVLELSIKDISIELQVSESYVKNIIYRTLKELCSLFGKECN